MRVCGRLGPKSRSGVLADTNGLDSKSVAPAPARDLNVTRGVNDIADREVASVVGFTSPFASPTAPARPSFSLLHFSGGGAASDRDFSGDLNVTLGLSERPFREVGFLMTPFVALPLSPL